MVLPQRKSPRLKGYDYSAPGAYFVTICTKNKQNLLGSIVGTGVLDGPLHKLSAYGEIAHKYIVQLKDHYAEVLSVDNYVVMPNHIHLLVRIYDGPSRTPVPTPGNKLLPQFVSTFKRFCNKEYGENIWQARFHDHIIRNSHDYQQIFRYISENPIRWTIDRFYTE